MKPFGFDLLRWLNTHRKKASVDPHPLDKAQK
jgi:hypothetical protein